MSEKIVQLNEEIIKGQVKELVRGSVKETLNELLEQEAEKLTQDARISEMRLALATVAATMTEILPLLPDVTLHIPRFKGVSFETAIIERYRRRESSVEEALIEMYLAGVSVRRVEDITEAQGGEAGRLPLQRTPNRGQQAQYCGECTDYPGQCQRRRAYSRDTHGY